MNKRFEGILNKMSRNKKKRNNEKIIIIILVQNLNWATTHLSRRQGVGRAGTGARLGARAHVGHRRQVDSSTGAGARGARQQATRARGGAAARRRGARARGAPARGRRALGTRALGGTSMQGQCVYTDLCIGIVP